MTLVNVTLENGQVIKFETADQQDYGVSHSVDIAGVLMIESRRVTDGGELVTTRYRYSPGAWHSIEETDSSMNCTVPPWLSGVIDARY